MIHIVVVGIVGTVLVVFPLTFFMAIETANKAQRQLCEHE